MREATSMLGTTELETKTFSIAMLLDAIRRGAVRIPGFHRSFRWTDEDRRLLLDSVQLGVPIGALVLARGQAPADHVVLGGYTVDVPAVPDALWVVDGQHRLTTLATTLLESNSGAYSPVFFDLVENRFVIGRRRHEPLHTWVPAHVLSSFSSLVHWLRQSMLPDVLADRAEAIALRIREYPVPAYIVPYDAEDDSLLKHIFLRINRRGRALESHEMFQALHTSMSGEKGPIDRVRDDLAQLGFGALEPRIIERTAIAVLGGDPGRALQDQEDLQHRGVLTLFNRVSSSLGLTIEFLANDAGVPHGDLLPWTGALPTLARFFSVHPRPHVRNRELLSRWFWRGVLSGNHKTDNRADRLRWQAITSGDGADEHVAVQSLLRLLPRVDEKDLPSGLQAYRRGVARVDVELLAMYALGPRWLVGDDKGLDVFISSLIEDEKVTFPWQIVEPEDDAERTSALFLLHPNVSIAALRAEPPDAALLATHGIDPQAFHALLRGAVKLFTARRTAVLVSHLRAFLRERAALAPVDRDRPPLDAYFTEEGA
jgi:hypothetical protein